MKNAIVLTCMFVFVLAIQATAYDWVVNPSNGHRYTVVEADMWLAAEALAVDLGGHLVTIGDAAENEWVLLNVVNPTGHPVAWIGLYQLPGSPEPDGGWAWASGETMTYTNWNPTSHGGPEPNNAGGGEDWAAMYSSHYVAPGRWNDIKPSPGFVESPLIGIVEVIPEPTTVLALLCGLPGLAWRYRKKDTATP